MKTQKTVNLNYKMENEILIPDLKIAGENNETLGKYGLMRLEFLKTHRKGTYTTLLTEGKLKSHLCEIEKTAREEVAMIIERQAKLLGVNESLKASDQMKWVGLMNNIKQSAEEEILNSLIYA